jgi:hypothetical protein
MAQPYDPWTQEEDDQALWPDDADDADDGPY